MYVPQAYQAPDARAVVRDYPFALVISGASSNIFATSTPVYFETDDPAEQRLIGHLANSNPHAAALRDGDPVMAVFQGPHAYISSSWYVDRPTVPTWNYVAAQVQGTLQRLPGRDELLGVLTRTAQLAEAWNPTPWTLAHAPPGKIDELLPRIIAFRIVITDISGAAKLSQTQPASDRRRIVDALERRGLHGDGDIARLMRHRDGF